MKTEEEKRRESRLKSIGYRGRMENYDIIDWLMGNEKLCVTALPFADNEKMYVWRCCVVLLSKPSTIDGMLHGTDIGKDFATKREAEFAGIDFILSILEAARADLERLHNIFMDSESEFEREVRKDIERLREKGFDV